MNSERFRVMLTEFLWPKLTELNVNELWLQQDGATSHISHEIIALIAPKFGDGIISKKL